MLVCGDARRIPLPDNSVQMCVTSPPYWGLRKYAGEQGLVWGGQEDCEHDFTTESYRRRSNDSGKTPKQLSNVGANRRDEPILHGTCLRCIAWRGAYGLEPTVEMYVQHTVEILREIRRVLRPDGVCFWNIGDSYASAWASGRRSVIGQGSRTNRVERIGDGLKEKDLCLIPQRVALAAQMDGWWVRSDIVWAKPNPMPESVNGWRWEQHRIKVKPSARAENVYQKSTGKQGAGVASRAQREAYWERGIGATEWTDCPGCPKCAPNNGLILRKGAWRPTGAYEHILMLTKSEIYYCDADAVAEDMAYGSKRNLRSVWAFATQPFSGAHFATFPEELVRRCIKAATSEKGCCPKCRTPWVQVVQKVRSGGWQPGCACNAGAPVSCLCLDPFAGSGTVGVVALKLGRRAVLLDLAYQGEPGYQGLARKRITGRDD